MVEKAHDNDSPALTEDEAQLYDRQIRLWGLDAQRRLRGARVLLVGVGGLGAEVAKNIVLAGIKSLTLMDHTKVTKEDFCCQFFVRREDLGQNRAESSQSNIQLLNPMVEVSADISDVADKSDEFFKSFDIVCATCCSRSELLRINGICREHGIKFYAGDVCGFYGFMFADLIHHDYAEEIPASSQPAAEADIGDGEPSSKKAKVTKVIMDTTVTVKKATTFTPLAEALDMDWSSVPPRKLQRTPNTYFIMQILQEFREQKGRNVSIDHVAEDKETLKELKTSILNKLKVTNKQVVPEDFAEHCFAGLSPVCAVVGGVLGQEIIKAVSQKDAPHNNFFFFNGTDGSGMVDCFKK